MAESVKGARLAPFVKAGQFDALMSFKDAGLVAASAAAQVGGSAKVVDMGTGLFQGCMIVDVSAIEVQTDEKYTICVQLSTAPAFADDATSVTAVMLELGHATPLLLGANSTPGRYKMYFDNEHDGVLYRYARVYTVVVGTIATGIDYSAYAVPMK
jgi:hypothetical protein